MPPSNAAPSLPPQARPSASYAPRVLGPGAPEQCQELHRSKRGRPRLLHKAPRSDLRRADVAGPEKMSLNRATKGELSRIRNLCPEAEIPYWRPSTRSQCLFCPDCDAYYRGTVRSFPRLVTLPCGHNPAHAVARSRPCLFVSCKWSLFLDEMMAGGIRISRSDLEPWEIDPRRSCVLDVAEGGARSLVYVARIINSTREYVRQLEEKALSSIADGLAPIMAEATGT